MILSIVIIALLIGAIFRGYHRGLVKELLFTLGTFLIFLVALYYDSRLGSALLTLTKTGDPTDPLASFIAQTISFWLILLIGNIIVRWVARLSRSLTWIPVIKQANGLGGALIAIIITYLGIFLALALLNVIGPDWFNNQYINSNVAQFIIERTPLLGQNVVDWLFNTDTKTFTNALKISV